MERMSAPWQIVTLTGESLLYRESRDTMMLFGRGPRLGPGASAQRMEGVLSELEGVRALRFGRQIHGNLIASLSEEPGQPFEGVAEIGRCDGLISDTPGLSLALWTADCVPVLFSGGGVVAAIHAGWRGIAAGIHLRAVRRFLIEYGVPASGLRVVLGPAVGPCHYEVGEEVIEALGEEGVHREHWLDGQRVDLRAFLRKSFEGLGIDREAIEIVGPCTACDEAYASYRRDGARAGRQFSLVALARRADRRP